MIKVIYNNQCSKSKAILEYLDENNVKFQIIDIIKEPLSFLEIKTLLKKLNKKPSKILKKSTDIFNKYFTQTEEVNEDKALEVITQNQDTIPCPILIKGKVAMVVDPLENVKFFIGK